MLENNEKFNFFVEAEFEKAKKDITKGSEEWYKNMYVQGQASSTDQDTDGETLEPSGYVLDRFLKSGLLNYEHLGKKSASYYIGEPTAAVVKNNKFFIKGWLWEKSEKARDLWDTMHVMAESGSKRKVGWSIEGKALQRDPMNEKRIIKALITHCALTFSPKNANTWADIVKGEQEQDYIEYENDAADGGSTFLLDVTQPSGVRITIDKEFNIKVDKSMGVGSSRPLIPESVEKKTHNLQQATFFKNMKTLAKFQKNIGLDQEILKKIQKNIKKLFEFE